jgi:hypothetical protein
MTCWLSTVYALGSDKGQRQREANMSDHASEAPEQANPATQFRLVTTYRSASKDAADENQRRIEAVFAELVQSAPDNVTYLVFRLADDSFLHVSFHGHAEDEHNPIASLPAFRHFGDGHSERRDGSINQQRAELVGAYVTGID